MDQLTVRLCRSLHHLALHLTPEATSRLARTCLALRAAAADDDIWRLVHDISFGGDLLGQCGSYQTSCARNAVALSKLRPEGVAHWAAVQGHHRMLMTALDRTAHSPEQLASFGCLAAARGHCHVLAMLSRRRCDLSLSTNLHTKGKGRRVTPLQVASRAKQNRAVEYISLLTASPHELLVHHIGTKNHEGVAKALAAGATIQLGGGPDGGTVLHSVAGSGSVELAKLLVENCGQRLLNARDQLCRTALICAIKAGAVAVAEVLLDAGATAQFPQIETLECHGRYVPCSLLTAVEADSPACLQLMLDREVECLPANGKKQPSCALVRACGPCMAKQCGHSFQMIARDKGRVSSGKEMCAMLLESKADVNMADLYGNTALHVVVGAGSSVDTIGWMEMLVDANANLDATNSQALTPLGIAAVLEDSAAVVTWLLENGADCGASGVLHGLMYSQHATLSSGLAGGGERWERFQQLVSGGASLHMQWYAQSLLDVLCRWSVKQNEGSSSEEVSRAVLHLQTDMAIAEHLLAAGLTADASCLRFAPSTELCRCLLNSGVDPNIDSDDGMLPPLHDRVAHATSLPACAPATSDIAIIRLLLLHGADPNSQASHDGSNALVTLAAAFALVCPRFQYDEPDGPQYSEYRKACQQILDALLEAGASFEAHSYHRMGAPHSVTDILDVPWCAEEFIGMVNASEYGANAGSPAWRPAN